MKRPAYVLATPLMVLFLWIAVMIWILGPSASDRPPPGPFCRFWWRLKGWVKTQWQRFTALGFGKQVTGVFMASVIIYSLLFCL